MPNWSYNTISVRGEKAQVINWLNKGLKQEKCKTLLTIDMSIEKIKEICSGAKLSLDSFNPMPKTFTDWDTTNQMKCYIDWLCDGYNNGQKNNSPLLDSQDVYKAVKTVAKLDGKEYTIEQEDEVAKKLFPQYVTDYEKYCKGYKSAKKFQEKTYEVVGWYAWGLKYRGTKWNSLFDFNNCFDWKECNGILYIHLKCDTAWNLPDAWIVNQQRQWENNGLNFFIRAKEEDCAYNGFGHANDIFEIDIYTREQAYNEIKESGQFDEENDEFYDAVYEREDELDDLLDKDYLNFIYQS